MPQGPVPGLTCLPRAWSQRGHPSATPLAQRRLCSLQPTTSVGSDHPSTPLSPAHPCCPRAVGRPSTHRVRQVEQPPQCPHNPNPLRYHGCRRSTHTHSTPQPSSHPGPEPALRPRTLPTCLWLPEGLGHGLGVTAHGLPCPGDGPRCPVSGRAATARRLSLLPCSHFLLVSPLLSSPAGKSLRQKSSGNVCANRARVEGTQLWSLPRPWTGQDGIWVLSALQAPGEGLQGRQELH